MMDETIVAQVEADPIENNNPIEDLLNHIQTQQYTDAEQAFNDIIGDRLQDKLDQAKIRIADQMFNAQQEEDGEEDLEEYEFDDDIDLELDDFEEEDDED
jgi:hypothetical protein